MKPPIGCRTPQVMAFAITWLVLICKTFPTAFPFSLPSWEEEILKDISAAARCPPPPSLRLSKGVSEARHLGRAAARPSDSPGRAGENQSVRGNLWVLHSNFFHHKDLSTHLHVRQLGRTASKTEVMTWKKRGLLGRHRQVSRWWQVQGPV